MHKIRYFMRPQHKIRYIPLILPDYLPEVKTALKID